MKKQLYLLLTAMLMTCFASTALAKANQPATPSSVSAVPTAINPTYTGVMQALVNAGEATGGTMYYSLDNDVWSTAIPTAKNAGNYTVYYKVIGDDTHTDYTPDDNAVAVTIAKTPLTITASEKWISYGDPLQYLEASYNGFVNGEGPGYVQPAVKFASDYTQGDNAGTYTITPYGAGAVNYAISYVSGTLHVNKIYSVITTAPTAIDGLVATGNPQVLITAGEATGGQMQYSLNYFSWSTDLPTATDAGIYTVYYIVMGDVNHYSTSTASIEVTIAPTDIVITPYPDPQHAGVYYSTFYDSNFKYALPAGVEAYVATYDGANLLLTKTAEAGEVIPDDEAVILKASVSPFTLTPSDGEAVPYSAMNDLQGTDVSITTPNNCYVLAGTDGVVGFYHYTGANLNPHKAYVTLPGGGMNQAPRRMPFVFNQATDVENIQGDNVQSTKVLENGVLYIIKNGVKYNTQGHIVK